VSDSVSNDDRTHPLRCSECQQPLGPEIARTDEDGNAIHAECYVLRLKMKRGATPSDE
jgi:hypothetical protein